MILFTITQLGLMHLNGVFTYTMASKCTCCEYNEYVEDIHSKCYTQHDDRYVCKVCDMISGILKRYVYVYFLMMWKRLMHDCICVFSGLWWGGPSVVYSGIQPSYGIVDLQFIWKSDQLFNSHAPTTWLTMFNSLTIFGFPRRSHVFSRRSQCVPMY